MRKVEFLITILVLFVVFSCQKEEQPLENPYLEFVSPSDADVLINSDGSWYNPIIITLKTNRDVSITSIDSSSNNVADWIFVHFSQLNKETVNLLIEVQNTLIRRTATITVTTKSKNEEDIEQKSISILLRQSTIHMSSAGTLKDDYFGGAVYGGWAYSTDKIDITGKIDARDIYYMNTTMQSLKAVDISDIAIEAYAGNEGTVYGSLVSYPANEMPQNSFAGKKILSSIVLPTTLTRIGNSAFAGCGLIKIDVPANVTSIGASAFNDCEKLANVNLPANLTSIEEGAFGDCEQLTSISLPDKLTTIQDGTFSHCYSLISIDFPSNLTSIGQSAFRYCKFQILNFPTGLKSIGAWAFDGCSSLNSIIFPTGLISIGEYAFSGGCNEITELHLPDGLISIGTCSFQACNGLKTITFPASLASIGSSAFNGCFNLKEIICYSENPVNMKIGTFAFSSDIYSTCILKVPAVALELYKTADVWKDFKNIETL